MHGRRFRIRGYYRLMVSPSAAIAIASSFAVSTIAIPCCFVSTRSVAESAGEMAGGASFSGTGDGGEVDNGDAYCELLADSGGEGLADDSDANGDSHIESDSCDSLYTGGGERLADLGLDLDRDCVRAEPWLSIADEKREVVGGGVDAVIVAWECVCACACGRVRA